MITKLIELANKLDKLGEYEFADEVDALIRSAGADDDLEKEGLDLYNKVYGIVQKWIQDSKGNSDYIFKTAVLVLESILTEIKLTQAREEEAFETWLKKE